MAKDQNDVKDLSDAQEQEKKAQDKVNVPAAVTTNADDTQKAYADYIAKRDSAKDKIAKYGETDLQQFLTKIASNGVYAQQVVSNLLGLEDDPAPGVFSGVSGANQQNNVTGKLDHSGDVAIKLNQ